MINKILSTLLLLTCILFSCKSIRTGNEKRQYVNKWKIDSEKIVRNIPLDTNDAITAKRILEKAEETIDNAKETSNNQKETSAKRRDNIYKSTQGEYRTELLKKENEVIEKIKFYDSELEKLYEKTQELEDFYSVENLEKLKNDIAEEEYRKYIEKYPNKELDSNDFNLITNLSNKRFNKVLENKARELSDNSQKIKVLIANKSTVAYELAIIDANTELTRILWKISSHSHFETGKSTLSKEDSISIIQDYQQFFDSVIYRVKQANTILVNKEQRKKISLYAYIDGYADSKGFGKNSDVNKRKNRALSEDRAKTIQQIFNTVSSINYINNKDIFHNRIYSEIVGHGTKKPDINVQFEAEGNSDENRRIVIVQCSFLPMK